MVHFESSAQLFSLMSMTSWRLYKRGRRGNVVDFLGNILKAVGRVRQHCMSELSICSVLRYVINQ